ncbi:hypothetical protein E2C01_099560 [Portunus trituberculatus]|uniref:Uncharacterized protein n=1 Tax=Portunus trituberculatus TaxID=210409 RepID=A0A5B7K0M2_PORTR|nr:hypothetical protein [Portunus trituberculatus]
MSDKLRFPEDAADKLPCRGCPHAAPLCHTPSPGANDPRSPPADALRRAVTSLGRKQAGDISTHVSSSDPVSCTRFLPLAPREGYLRAMIKGGKGEREGEGGRGREKRAPGGESLKQWMPSEWRSQPSSVRAEVARVAGRAGGGREGLVEGSGGGRREGEFLAFHDPHPPATVQHLLPPLGGGREVVKREGRKSNIEERKK